MFNLTSNKYQICNLFNEQKPDSTLLQAQQLDSSICSRNMLEHQLW